MFQQYIKLMKYKYFRKNRTLIFHSRVIWTCINLILTFLQLRFFKKFDAKNLIFLTLILVTSNGFLTHTSQYRVEPMTLLLFLISILLL